MLQMNHSTITHHKLLLFKWLMIFMPSVTVAVGHSLIGGAAHGLSSIVAILPVTFLGLVLTYIFVEILFRGIGKLQAQALAREQDIQSMNAVMQERERLSRELHDGAAQLVAHLLLRLDTIKELVQANRPEEAGAELEQLRGVADEIYEDIGESITGLRANVTEQGLVCALRDYMDQFEERHRISTSLQADSTADHLSPPAALQLFRFIQEALTNVRKHAAAKEVTVTLIADGSRQLKVIVADDGQGFTPGVQKNGKARPLGLTGMRERIEALGGAFRVDSQPGLGTQVIATIPTPRVGKEASYATLATPAG
jgi:signal transduction histidine kinase